MRKVQINTKMKINSLTCNCNMIAQRIRKNRRLYQEPTNS